MKTYQVEIKETFCITVEIYDPCNQIVTRKNDGHSFELDEFLSYAFQCDVEGYSHTEYVDIAPGG